MNYRLLKQVFLVQAICAGAVVLAAIAFAALLLLSGNALAADDPKAQLEALQAELRATRDQRNAAHDQIAAIIAGATAQIEALKKQLVEAQKPKDAPK